MSRGSANLCAPRPRLCASGGSAYRPLPRSRSATPAPDSETAATLHAATCKPFGHPRPTTSRAPHRVAPPAGPALTRKAPERTEKEQAPNPRHSSAPRADARPAGSKRPPGRGRAGPVREARRAGARQGHRRCRASAAPAGRWRRHVGGRRLPPPVSGPACARRQSRPREGSAASQGMPARDPAVQDHEKRDTDTRRHACA